MKLLRCKLCRGEMDIISGEKSVQKKVKCQQCGFSNDTSYNNQEPEIVVIRKRKNP